MHTLFLTLLWKSLFQTVNRDKVGIIRICMIEKVMKEKNNKRVAERVMQDEDVEE